jgi:hypothetical protein
VNGFKKNIMRNSSVKKGLLNVSFLVLILILISLGIVTSSSIADSTNVIVTVEWETFFGDSGDDSALACIQTSDGGFVALVSTDEIYTTGQVWSSFVKFSANGQQEWNITILELDVWGNHLVQTADDGYVVVSLIGDFGSDSDVLLRKYSSTGQPEWNSSFGGDSSDWCNSLIIAEDGGFVFAGAANYNDSLPGDLMLDYDLWLVKTDSQGVLEWNHTYGGDMSDLVNSVIQTSDGGYALACRTDSYGLDSSHAFLVKTNASGQLEWNKTFDRGSAGSPIQNTDGTYVFRVKYWDGVKDNFYLLKVDSTGNQIWNSTYNTIYEANSLNLIQTIDEGYLLAGDTGDTSPKYELNHDLWFLKTDTNGVQEWNVTHGGSGDQRLNSVFQMADGSFVIAGSTQPPDKTDTDMWLLKVQVVEETTTTTSTTSGTPSFEFGIIMLSFVLSITYRRKMKLR